MIFILEMKQEINTSAANDPTLSKNSIQIEVGKTKKLIVENAVNSKMK